MPNKIESKLIDTIKTESAKHNNTSRTHGEPCWAPPKFPEAGRLTLTEAQIVDNYEKLVDKETLHSKKAKDINENTCCKTLHVSLFFDGTNNNNYYDTDVAAPPHPSNVAKLYHASAPDNDIAMDNGFYSFYIPGVGTPFPEIRTYEYYSAGLTFATGGEARISWGLIQICNALYHAVTGEEIPLAERRAVLDKMSSDLNFTSLASTTDFVSVAGGAATGYSVGSAVASAFHPFFSGLGGLIGGALGAGDVAYNKLSTPYNPVEALEELLKPLKWKLSHNKPKLVALKIYAYGFSRGAAEARTFAYWLDKWLDYHHDNVGQFYSRKQKNGFSYVPKGTFYGLPVSIDFLGLFDTVAAVGLANVVPMATGHNSWAAGTQQLPKSSLIKNTCHLVAAHEQRQCFTVDSIRTPNGNYPPNSIEVIYPGMHSDVGGGYPPKDQGKALNGSKDVLSQIALHDMYAAAIDAGAPLAISQDSFSQLPELAEQYAFRIMSDSSQKEFVISEDLVNKFNAWRTYSLPEQTPSITDSPSACFNPPRFTNCDLEFVMEIQLILITAWRIGRYATPRHDPCNLTQQTFFQQAPLNEKISVQPYDPAFSTQASAALAEEAKKSSEKINNKAIARGDEQKRVSDLSNWQPNNNNLGTPLFDATNARGQLWEASLEFKADLEGMPRPQPLIDMTSRRTKAECEAELKSQIKPHEVMIGSPFPVLLPRVTQEDCQEAPEFSFPLGTSVQSSVIQLLKNFNPYVYMITDQNEHQEYLSLKTVSLVVFEKLMSPQMKKTTNDKDLEYIIKMFDDHVHDSRAWFMHSDSGVLEPFSGYFLSRMIYFGDKWSKSMQLIVNTETIYGYQGNTKLVGVSYKPLYGVILIDLSTGKEIPINTDQRPSPTHNIMEQILSVIEQQKKDEHRHNQQALHAIAEK